MASSSKKQRTKPPKGRPLATSALTQPVVQDSSSSTFLSSFSPNGNFFAFLSLAIDKHRLRVYDTGTGQAVAEHVADTGHFTSLTWSYFDPSDKYKPAQEDGSDRPSKKQRKKLKNMALEGSEADSQTSAIEVIVLGVSDGTLLLFSPIHGRILRKLSHSTCTAAILSVVATQSGEKSPIIWTSGADGAIRLWDANKNDILASWKNDDRIPYSSMAVRPESSAEHGGVEIVVANHGIHLLSTPSDLSSEIIFETQKPKELATFTGHASSITRLQWDTSKMPSTRFLSMAQADRFVYVWEVPAIQAGFPSEGKIIGSIPLDSDARSISLSLPASKSTSTNEKQTLLTLSASGKISIYPVPSELTPLESSSKAQHKVPTLIPRSNVTVSSKNSPSALQVIDASFVTGEQGRIRVARLVGGVKPVFHLIDYLDESKNFIQSVNFVDDDSVSGITSQSSIMAPNKRYTESSSLAIHSGIELGHDQEMDDLATRDVEGELDVDLAELSLGQRLTALSGGDERLLRGTSSDSDDEGADQFSKSTSKKEKKKQSEVPSVVPANSLTRTLIQALHSSDSGLLETCLGHSDRTLIRNTVRRLPSQLALPLITACLDRLGRGARAGTMKGGGGGASSQRAAGLTGWIKAVLVVHCGYLMTMPDLIARLSGLHATLTNRLALQESLLSLSGRLDMVLSQIETRSSAAPAPLAPQKGKKTLNGQREVRRYVEGESDEEEEAVDVEVEMESADGADSAEDVELGGDSDDEEEMSEEDEDSDADDDSEYGGPSMDGFIDDEAEESGDEEDESE